MRRRTCWTCSLALHIAVLLSLPLCGLAQTETIVFLSSSHHSVMEEQPVGTLVHTITVYYTLAGQAYQDGVFSISSTTGDHTNFTLDPSDGMLQTAAVFDRDAEGAQVTFSFQVTYTTPRGTSDTKTIHVAVVDVNDNSPMFVTSIFNVSVYEATSPGVTFATILATDPDVVQRQQQVDYEAESIGSIVYTVENGRVIYDLLEGEGPLGIFNLNPDTGNLSISEGQLLDYDVINYYNYTIRARDGDNQTDYADLIIHVLDSNNHPPIIQGPFNVSVTLPEDTPSGRVIVEAINATDGDHGSNSEITFKITRGDPRGFFVIDEKTGKLTTGILDREYSDFLTLTITATDDGTPPLSDTLVVHVALLDVNDSPPEFSQSTYTVSVTEGGPRFRTVLTVSASDPDLNENGTFNFSLLQTNLPFAIDPNTGEITTSALLDRESIDLYTLTVFAVDKSAVEEFRLTSSVNITVTVTDRNDNSPYFDVEYFRVEILDNSTVGEHIFTMTARDDDIGSNAQITWEILGVNGRRSDFRFNLQNGKVFVDRDIRFQVQSEYNYSIRAWDRGNPRSSNDIMLYIVIHDVNVRRPHFYQPTYNVTLYENVSVGEVVLNVSAFDNDNGPTGEIRFRIVSVFDEAGGFEVDPVSGAVSVAQPLDYDFRSQIQFQIEVYDGGFPVPKTDLAIVTVDLIDINDNCPFFTFNLSNFFKLPENSKAPRLVANVSSYLSDPDTGLGGVFNYSISRGGFEVLPPDEEDPVIITVWEFNSTLCNTTGLDDFSNGTLCELNSTLCNVTSEDYFNNGTICNGSYVNVTRVVERGPVIRTHFELEAETGLLTSGRVFDRETEPFVTIEFAFQDYGDPPLSCRHNVSVEIVDDNDNDPYFLGNVSGSIIEFNQVGEQIVTITAVDDDINDNARITYIIYSGNARNSFGIFPDNGTIYAAVALNKTIQSYYALGIVAVDNGNPRRMSRHHGYVFIDVLDFNDNPPQFAADVLNASVPENNLTEFYIVKAVDVDVGSNANITYSILDSDDSHHFTLDPVDGILATVDAFDAENETVILLEVVAMDMGLIPLSSLAVVMVTILDENDNAPYFLNDSYSAHVVENSHNGTYVLTVEAFDDDRDSPNNKITYSLDEQKGSLFSIGADSGVITVAMEIDRENCSTFTFEVTAKDGGNPPLSAVTTVTIDVGDINDNPPLFDSNSLQLGVVEDSPRGTYVGTLVTTDTDEAGNNTAVLYDIVVDFSDGKFELDSVSGNVTATEPLNREERDNYDLIIRATDGGIPSLSTEETLRIRVLDFNDHTPVFNQSQYTATIPEDTPISSLLLKVKASDADVGVNGEIHYSLEGSNHFSFTINTTTGELFPAVEFDYETINEYRFIVVARDNGNPPRSTTAGIEVTITDVNDNPPQFVGRRPYSGTIYENFAIGTKILQVSATDIDTGFGSQIRFSLENGYGNFAIHEVSGVIYTIGHLDREKSDLVELVVIASNPFAPVQQNSTEVVSVTVLDINDNHPVFQQPFYEVHVDETTPSGSRITLLTAEDGDLAENGSVSYSLVEGSYSGLFSINDSTGEVLLHGVLDYETPPTTYVLSIRASDGSPQQLSNHTTLVVVVDDVNDNQPVFVLAASTVSIGYGVIVGTEVVTLVAIDNDTPSVSPLTYSIIAGDEYSLFSIPDISTGRIETALDVSSYAGKAFELVIEASDGTYSAQHNLTVEVVPPSANKPVFNSISYSGSIDEDVSSSTEVLVVYATSGTDYFFFEDDNDIHDDTFTTANLFREYSYFTIDSSGHVRVAMDGTFDYEKQNVYQLNIVSNNSNGFAYTMATIRILDVNDNPPYFPTQRYVVSVSESLRPNTVILQLSAVDGDGTPANRMTSYTLTSSTAGGGVFTVGSDGQLRLSSSLDYENGDRNFTLVVTASDDGNPTVLRNETAVDIIVMEDNDNVPTLSRYSYVFEFNETTPSGTVLAVDLNASDADMGFNGEITYGITGNLLYTDIDIDPHSGSIMLISPLDWEREDSYILQVHVTDMGNPPQETLVYITLNVLDLNDNDPEWELDQYRIVISEDTPLEMEVIHVRATDVDHVFFTNDTGVVIYHITNGLVRYSISDGDPNRYFRINSETGVVTVNEVLDREDVAALNITLTATDGGGRHVNATLFVEITDVNDNPPSFTMATYVKYISEHLKPNSTIVTVVAYDNDLGPGSKFNYSIEIGNENETFALNSTSGELELLLPLDREVTPLYNLTVVAIDTGSPMLTGTTQVVIHIQDENDHAPLFTDPSYSVLVPENTSVSTAVFQVSASDDDIGANGAVVYRLFAVTTEMIFVNETFSNETEEFEVLNKSDHFEINSTSGEISVINFLDYETTMEYNLVVVAMDSAQEVERLSTTVELTIFIDDVNDNIPIFVEDGYFISVEENAIQGYPLVNVTAEDSDIFDTILYSIVSGVPDSNSFKINGNGTISVAGPIDRELVDVYVLRVDASDTASPPHVTITNVTITVLDRNEHSPVFSEAFYTSAILENQPIGLLVTSDISVTDADAEATSAEFHLEAVIVGNKTQCVLTCGNFSFCIQLNSSSAHNSGHPETYFDVHPLTGTVLTNVSFDRETLDLFVLVVVATDGGSHPNDIHLSSSVCVVVEIRDLNDNDPLFTEAVYEVIVVEESVPSTPVLILTTSDADLSPHTQTTFRITHSTQGGGAFVLDSQGQLNLTRGVDREVNPVINLTVVAENTENSHRSSQAVITVVTTDINDNHPTFNQSLYSVSTPEGTSPGVVIAMLTATDRDLSRNAELTYSISSDGNSTPFFSIHPENGSVYVNGNLDRESIERHTLLFTATDHGTRPLNSSVYLIVNVTDRNDNAPIFSEEHYVTTVIENEAAPAAIFTVMATDADTSPNDDIVFSIHSVSPDTNAFIVDNVTGIITMESSLDAEMNSLYVLTVVADNGPQVQPQLSTTTTVTIIVADINDNPPLFQSPSFTIAVSEQTEIGTSIFILTVEDHDITEQNSNFYFTILAEGTSSNATLPVTVDQSNGSILVQQLFDYEVTNLHEFDVVVVDTGTPSLNSTTHVVLRVLDENDNFPVFSQQNYSFAVFENGLQEELVGIVIATDVDTSVLRYYIEDGEDGSWFQIDFETGIIETNSTLDREEQDKYMFNVTVVDTGTNDVIKMAVTTVTVAVLDRNDNPPVFYSEVFATSIPENVTLGVPILNTTAIDLDVGLNAHITYSLIYSADSSHFRINSTTSELETARAFDREIQSTYSFTVQAVDGGEPPNTATADILIVITDINDNNPLFHLDQYSGIIDENVDIRTSVINLMANDNDIDENGEYRFSLDGSHFDAFVVDPISGVIETAAAIDYEERQFYNFVAIVTDLGDPPLESTVSVSVEIVDLNDNPPVFDSAVYDVAIAENSILDKLVFQIPATDEDSTSNSDLQYTITHGNLDAYFALDEEEGQITVARYLDREVVDSYLMQLQVVDQGDPQYTATAQLRIQVIDENDNNPLFPQQQFVFNMDELLDGESVVVAMVTATDSDIGVNADLEYSIVGDNFGGRFAVDPLAGTITARGPILFNEEKSFTVILQAADGGIPTPLTDSTAVHIVIDDVNRSPPTTSLSQYEVDYQFLENLIYLQASDPDRNPTTNIEYTITDNATSFSIDSTGTVSSTTSIDALVTNVITVSISDGHLTSGVLLTLNGYPSMTNKPIFSPVAKTIVVMETTAVNTTIGSVTTFPTGNEVLIRLPTTSSTSAVYSDSSLRDGLELLSQWFEITSDGSIILKDPSILDKEKRDSIIVPVEAVDQVTMETAYGTVTIVIADENDSPPIFDNSAYYVGVSELISEGSTLLSVSAYDLDHLRNNSYIQYSLVSGDEDGHFSLDSTTGAITVESPLDREISSSHHLVVRATNVQSVVKLYSDVNVTVEVFDANDNTPMFSDPIFHIELLDNVTIGTEVFHPTVTDPDEGSNSQLVFSLSYQSHPGAFVLDIQSGVLSTAERLTPRISELSYRVTMAVTDRGAPIPRSTSAVILIDVYPVNHFPPVFKNDSYFKEISEILVPGSSVLTVVATDNDTSSNTGIRYSFASGNDDGKFSIDPNSGSISIVNSLNFHQQNFYHLVVVASDDGRPVTMTTTAVVNISILDVNNHSPEFSQSAYEVVVLENITIGTVVVVPTATDPDAASIVYTININSLNAISGDDLFAINRTTGEISTLGNLDHEQSHDHHLTISAMDTGYPTQRFTSVQVHVILTDLNDSPPKFTTDLYTSTVYRLQQAGTVVTVVTAIDPDTIGDAVMYSIVSDDSDGLFEINSTTGLVTVSREIPESTSCDECTLVVMATDGVQSSSVHLSVIISSDGTYCEEDFCSTVATRTRIRCPGNLEPSPAGLVCIAYSCTSSNTYTCVSGRTCVANGYSCLGVCPQGESVCPTTDVCHSVALETTCDGSNVTCLRGQVLVQDENGIRTCQNPGRISSSIGRQCVMSGFVYCVLLDECSNISAPDLCRYCPEGMVYCALEDACYTEEKFCCSVGEEFCDVLDTCIPPTQLCKLPNVAPVVTDDLYLAEVMSSFNPDTIYSSSGHVVGFLISSTNETAKDSQGEELGMAVVEVSDVAKSKGEWQFASCKDDADDDYGECSRLESDWTAIPTVSESNALILPPNTRVRFVRKSLVLEGATWMSVKLWDGNQDGYLSPAKNQTRTQQPHMESTLPFSPSGAFSSKTTLIVTLMHPEVTLPGFGAEGKTLQLTSINEEERPLHNLGDILEDLVGGVTLQELPVLASDVIGGFPSVPDFLTASHYQDLLPDNVSSDYFHAVAIANPPREQRSEARTMGQAPGVALSFDPPINSTQGVWQVSISGSAFLWQYLDNIIQESDLLLLNTSGRIRFLPAKDFHGNVTVRLQPWDGHWSTNIIRNSNEPYLVVANSSNQNLGRPNLNSITVSSLKVTGVEEGPSVTMTTYELDPVPYHIGYEYKRVFTVTIASPHDILKQSESNSQGISGPLSFTIGQSVQIKRLLPATQTSTFLTFSVEDKSTTLEELESQLRTSSLLQERLGTFSNYSKSTFHGPGECCHNGPQWETLDGTQVQQVANVVAIDDDSPVMGFAVVGISNGNHDNSILGVWQYYRSNYTDPSVVLSSSSSTYHPSEFPWINLPSDVSDNSAFLLRPQDRIRFVPHPSYLWSKSSPGAPHLLVRVWDLSLWQQGGEIPELHYYNVDVDPHSESLRSTVAPVGRFSEEVVKLAISRSGCDGIAGSQQVHDECCVCGGGGSPCSVPTDAPAVYNNCTSQDDITASLSCDFVPFSDSFMRTCSECLSEISITTPILSSGEFWNSTSLKDCHDTCYGTALVDSCNICSGGHSNHEYNSDQDCAGVCFGGAVIDDCNTCTGGSTGVPFNRDLDCTGVCGGPFVEDCGVCHNPTSPSHQTLRDCTGACFGEALVDTCGICYGGQSSTRTADSTLDSCGVCEGTNSSCVGCDGVVGSGVAVDACGTCGGNDCGCVILTSATPTRGPKHGGTEITIRGAGFFRNSTTFNRDAPNCGVPKQVGLDPISVSCYFINTDGSAEQILKYGIIINQSTITCVLSIEDDRILSDEYEIFITVDDGPRFGHFASLLYQTDDYSEVSVLEMLPSDSPVSTPPTVTFTGMNFINTSYIRCLITGFSSCTPDGEEVSSVEGRFLSADAVSCQLPMATTVCEITVILTLDGQLSGRVPQTPPTEFTFRYGTPPPLVTSVHFSSDLLNLLIDFDGPIELADNIDLECASIFNHDTLVTIGNTEATCRYSSDEQMQIAVMLPSVAMVSDGTQISFRDDVIVKMGSPLGIPIRNLSVPVNGSVNVIQPVAVIEGNPLIPHCPTTVSFHGYNSMYPGYRDFTYRWSVHVVDSSIQGYTELVEFLDTLHPNSNTLTVNSQWFQFDVEYYLQLLVQNSQGHWSKPTFIIVRKLSQSDSTLTVQIEGASTRTVYSNRDLFLKSSISIPACISPGIQTGYQYRWTVHEVTDVLRGTLEKVDLNDVAMETLHTLYIPANNLKAHSKYIMKLDVTNGNQEGSGNVTVTVIPWKSTVHLFGGSRTSVSRDDIIVLDTSLSPINNDLGKPYYSWTCIQVVSQQPCYNASDPNGDVIRINSGEPSVVLSASHLEGGVLYNFSFSIHQSDFSRTISHMLVEVKNQTGPSRLLVGISPVDVVTATDRTVLRGWIFSESNDVVAYWTSVNNTGYASVDLSDPTIALTSAVFPNTNANTRSANTIEGEFINEAYLVLAAGSLSVGHRYLFELTATINGGSYSSSAQVDLRVGAPPLVQDISVDPPTGDPLSTEFVVMATGSNVNPTNLPLTYRFGFPDDDGGIFWISGHLSSPSLETILPSVSTATESEIELIVQVQDNNGNYKNFMKTVALGTTNVPVATVVENIQTDHSDTKDWIRTLASIGSLIYHHSSMSKTLNNDIVGVITEILFNVSSAVPDTSSHHQLIAQYLATIVTHSISIEQHTSEEITTYILDTLDEHTFEFEIPNFDWSAQNDVTSILNQGLFSGAQSPMATQQQLLNSLRAVEDLMEQHSNSAHIRKVYYQMIDSISTGLCSVAAASESPVSLVTTNTRIFVQKYSVSSLRGVFAPTSCADITSCSFFELDNSFPSNVKKHVCRPAMGKTLPSCQEVCLQGSIEPVNIDNFVISENSENFISSEIHQSNPKDITPYSSIISSLSVPFLSQNGNGYVNLSHLSMPVTVELPLSGEVPNANESLLLCFHRQQGGGATHIDQPWTLDSVIAPLVVKKNGQNFAQCKFHHLTQFVLGILPIPQIEPSTSVMMSSTPMILSSMVTPSPTPTTPTEPPAPLNVAPIIIPIILILLIMIIIAAIIVIVVCWYKKRLAKVHIADTNDVTDVVAETDSVKIEDLRVPKDVIVLLGGGKRELYGKVLVMPSIKLKELREIIAGTFKEKLDRTPFYLLTTELIDIEPAVEPFQYLHIVYQNAIFIRPVLEHTEASLRHFCPCGKAAQFECSQCVSRGYCGQECQLNHWHNDHSKECKRFAEKRRRREILERRSSVQSGSAVTTPTANDGGNLSDRAKVIQDWRALIASRKSSRVQLRPPSSLTPIREQTVDSLATTGDKPSGDKPSGGTDDVDASTKYDGKVISMKPPPKTSDPFQSPSTRPATKPLPPVKRPSRILPTPPTTAPVKEKPMGPHGANSFYWNRFPSTVRQGQVNQLPPISRPPPPKAAFGVTRSPSDDFVPPQPLDPDTQDFDLSQSQGTRPPTEQTRPPEHQYGQPVQQTHPPTQQSMQPALFASTAPRVIRSLPTRMSIASITSQDLDTPMERGVSGGVAREEAILEDSQDSDSDSDTTTESSSSSATSSGEEET